MLLLLFRVFSQQVLFSLQLLQVSYLNYLSVQLPSVL